MKSMKSRSAARRWLIDGWVLAALVMVASFVMACRNAAFAPVEIDIVYTGTPSCPDRVDPISPTVRRDQKIIWQSIDADHGDDPVGREYRILFNPFVGKSLWWGNSIKSNKTSGEAKSRPVHKTTPNFDSSQAGNSVEFKYTVVSPDGPDGIPTCPPLDPRLRVGR